MPEKTEPELVTWQPVKWQHVADRTWRLPVPNGWLYSLDLQTVIFVPDGRNVAVK